MAICDDEAVVLEEVSSYIKKYCEQRGKYSLEVFKFDTASSLLNSINNGELFDIYILDVYIGDEMGTTFARNLRIKGIENPVIFLTTSIEHAPESLETNTLRYLIKPLNPEKFYEAMDVAISKAQKLGSKFIKLKTESGIENINISNVAYTEARSHYQYLNFINGDQVRARMTVAELFENFSDFGGFVRAGSSYIINLNKVKSISTSTVCFNNNKKLLLPRGAHNSIKEAFWKLQYEGDEN